MTLIPNWRQVLFGSWSSRLGLLATLLGGLEMALPAFQDTISRGWFAAACLLVTAAIPFVRIVQQNALHEEQQDVHQEQVEQKNG